MSYDIPASVAVAMNVRDLVHLLPLLLLLLRLLLHDDEDEEDGRALDDDDVSGP